MRPADAWDTESRGVFRLLAGVMLACVLALSSSLVISLQPGVARAASPSITIVSPSSASGPAETHMQVSGAGWNPGANVQLYYSQPANNQSCGDPTTSQSQASAHPFGNGLVNVQSNGSWVLQATQWPDGTGTGQFYICGFDVTNTTQVVASNKEFNVLSTTPPSLDAPQPPFPNAGDQVQISGHGFLPGNQPVDLWLTQTPNNPTQGTSLGTVTPDGSGSFTQQVTLPATISGDLTIVAESRASSGQPAPLVASVGVTIGATASTPTPTPTGSATPDPTATVRATATPASAGTGGSAASSTGKTILAFLLVLLTLVILAIFGVLIWYFVGIRPPAGAAPPAAAPAGRARQSGAPAQRGPTRRQSQAGWQGDDDWEDQQGPWEEDDQGGWGNAGYSPGQRGPADAPRPRAPSREDWRSRPRQGQDDW